MACVGGLRIDHAMALMRLWWCLPACGDQPRSGIYVYYPLDEMMALLRLESSRNQCLIIGEDLGVVPVEFREAMAASGLYGNRLMYFEQYRDGRFKPCREQQPDALLMTANHDVPTLSDWWQGSDLQRRRKLGLVDEREYSNQVLARQKDRHQLLQWLQQAEKLPAGLTADADQEYSESLCLAIHLACAASASQMLLLQLEDLQMMTEPVNIPGTYLEYPNWRRKQKLTLAEIFASHFSRQLLTAVNEERKRDNN